MTIDKRLKLGGWLALSLLLTLITYEAVQDYVQQQTSAAVKQQQQPLQYVLVSAQALEQGQMIASEVVVQRAYPENLVQDHWLRPEDAANVIGLKVNRFLERGEPITLDVLEFVETRTFASAIEPGAYAVTVSITREQLHGGLLSVGDKVTIFASTLDAEQQPNSLANIKVLALDQSTEMTPIMLSPEHYYPTTVTFLMKAEQARKFAQMQYQNYGLWLQHAGQDYPNITAETSLKIHSFNELQGSTHALFN